MLDKLAYAFGRPACSGVIRHGVEDFFVDEELGFLPDDAGEHQLLHVEKNNLNTAWLAGQLARFADIPKRDIGFAGLKDRRAVTRQWFSIGLAGKDEPDWSRLGIDGVRVLSVHRHGRKLRRGALKGNRFSLRVRDIEGDLSELETRLFKLKETGVPNYFGEQRFGQDAKNIEQAKAMFAGKRIKDRDKRSIYLSAARSKIFNDILSSRVDDASWNRGIAGDVMLLAGSNSFFLAEDITDEIEQRLAEFDIHPSGCLWGSGELATKSSAAEIEQGIADANPALCAGLVKNKVAMKRRALRLVVPDLQWQIETAQQTLQLEFSLPAGSYATSVLREIVDYQVAQK